MSHTEKGAEVESEVPPKSQAKPVAWVFELARARNSKTGEYLDFGPPQLSFKPPIVPAGAARNVKPLYSFTFDFDPSVLQDVLNKVAVTIFEKAVKDSASSIVDEFMGIGGSAEAIRNASLREALKAAMSVAVFDDRDSMSVTNAQVRVLAAVEKAIRALMEKK